MNELGICIRPVLNRSSFINESSIINTTLALGANAQDGTSQVIIGTYNTQARDMSFTNSIAMQSNGSISEVKLLEASALTSTTQVPISKSVFFVAQDTREAQSQGTGAPGHSTTSLNYLQTISVTNSSNSPVLQGPQNASASSASFDSVPESSIAKLDYANDSTGGLLYALGSPATKLYCAQFSPISAIQSDKAKLQFLPPAYETVGITDPYYVGSYSTMRFDSNANQFVTSSVGNIQTGLNVQGPNAQQTTLYNASRPLDPLPQDFTLTSVSDICSRGLVSPNLQNSYGYVFAGAASLGPAYGQGISVRYWSQDPNLSQNPALVPNAQENATIDLQFGPNAGIIRMARFDVQNNSQGINDTLYVFGKDNGASGPNPGGPVLSFITEQFAYQTNDTQLSFHLRGPTQQSQAYQLQTNSANAYTIANAFVAYLNEVYSAPTGASYFTLNESLLSNASTFEMSLSSNAPNTLVFDLTFESTVDASLGSVLGFPSGSYSFTTMQKLRAPNGINVDALSAIGKYNGLAWDETADSYPETSNTLRTSLSATPVITKDDSKRTVMTGLGISAWHFDPYSQTLAFAVAETSKAKASAPLGSTNPLYQKITTIFDYTGSIQTMRLDPKCINVQVFVWGAGGSSDPNSSGYGGAGAFVSGHLDRSKWSPGQTLEIVVGGSAFGNGGLGIVSSAYGAGGGRSAIQIMGQDIVTAGGGGGSIGTGFGGAASADPLVQAQSGFPASNGGKGATSTSVGRGGTFYGDSRFKKALDGSMGLGGNSAWTITKKSLGGAGGGSGYFGGGAGGYLGYSGSPEDIGTGGGGGSSYSANLLSPLLESSESYVAPATGNAYYASNVAVGGTQSNGALGGPGRVVVVQTVQSSGQLNSSNGAPSNVQQSLWVSKYNTFSTMHSSNFGTISSSNSVVTMGPGDWSEHFYSIALPSAHHESEIAAMYTGLVDTNGTQIVVVVFASDSGALVEGKTSYVYWTLLGASSTKAPALTNKGTQSSFGPFVWTSSDGSKSCNVDSLYNVRSIRPFDASGTKSLMFVGDGVRIVECPSTLNKGLWQNPRFVIDSDANVPLEHSVRLLDGQLNEATNNVELVASPNAFSYSSVIDSPWAPQFASFYDSTDIPLEVISMTPWPSSTKASGTGRLQYGALGSQAGIVAPVVPSPTTPGPPLVDFTSIVSATGNVPMYATKLPNTCFFLRINGVTGVTKFPSWTFVNLYDSLVLSACAADNQDPSISALTSILVTPSNVIDTLQTCLTNALSNFVANDAAYSAALKDATVAVLVSPYNVLAITITNMSQNVTFDLGFGSTGLAQSDINSLFVANGSTNPLSLNSIDEAIGACGAFLGFHAGLVTTSVTAQTSQGSNTYETSFQAPNAIQLISEATGTNSTALVPYSIALPVNSVIAGSLYHIYCPVPKLCVVEPTIASTTTWPEGLALGIVCAIGGPIASALHTFASVQNSGSKSALYQPIPFPGSEYYIDFCVGATGKDYKWSILDYDNLEVAQGAQVPAFRSPANILVSTNGAKSYQYAQSLLGAYLKSTNVFSQQYNSVYAQTCLDSFHSIKADGHYVGIGPAKFQNLQTDSAVLNAAVSQFNDIKYYANPNTGDTSCAGFFLAVGQFLWELNAILGGPSIVWPKSLASLVGVAWVSLDGITWTTLPYYNTMDSSTQTELFWMVYNTCPIDITRASLSTDIGLYIFDIAQTLSTVKALFGLESVTSNTYAFGKPSPVTNFSYGAQIGTKSTKRNEHRLNLLPAARNGPYKAECTTRDATGTCIKCLGTSFPVTIPKVIGEGGTVLPNVDVCLGRPVGGSANPSSIAYSSVEASADTYAIAAYAGYDSNPNAPVSSYNNTLTQSFITEPTDGSNKAVIICPKYTNVNLTPSNVRGSDGIVANTLQCDLDLSFNKDSLVNSSAVDNGQTYGSAVVRRPAGPSGPDWTYSGGLYSGPSGPGFQYQPLYANELRQITFTPYDTFPTDAPVVPNSCPSTLGLGGSSATIDTNSLGLSTVYPTLAYGASGPALSMSIVKKLGNTAAYSAYAPGSNKYETGPFYENESFGVQGGNWNPRNTAFGKQDRAVLANEVGPDQPETLTNFSYAQLLKFVYNPKNQTASGTAQFQSPNPYLFRLSSYEYPYDGVAQDPDTNELHITIGRDPQVYEPGYGPLHLYVKTANTIASNLPWSANPLPQEGFGHWYVQYLLPWTIQNQFVPSPTTKNSIVYCALRAELGYGVTLFAPYGPTLWSNAVPYTAPIFLYDPSTGNPAQMYLQDMSSAPVSSKSALSVQNWTCYLPRSKRWSTFLQYTANQIRTNYSIWSLQNTLALRLFNQKDTNMSLSYTNNWKYLVAINFFRPRNWAFLNFTPESPAVSMGLGLAQQVLCSDQPNESGQYEFLVPDPFYTSGVVTFGRSIIGFPLQAYVQNSDGTTSQGPNYALVVQLVNNISPNVTYMYTSSEAMKQIVLQHNAFHYWTYGATPSQSTTGQMNPNVATLDIYINASMLLPSLTWQRVIQQTNCTLKDALQYYLANVNSAKSAMVQTLIDFDANPLRYFVWTDPGAQTTRSIWSMVQEGLTVVSTLASPFLWVAQVSNAAKLASALVDSDFTGSTSSLLHYQFSVTFHKNSAGYVSGSAANLAEFCVQNPNAICLHGFDSSIAPQNVPGFVPPYDPRAYANALQYGAQSNFQLLSRNGLVNVSSSDYDIELDNSKYFTGLGPQLRQDYLAQGTQSTSTTLYGDPVFGFGLRIDEGAVTPAPRKSQLASAGSIPTDHGYVSMVRTIVDGQARFGFSSSPDEVPHVHKLTYVTKYVPSDLKQYGISVELPPMRLLNGPNQGLDASASPNTDLVQNVLNPFRPQMSYFVNNIPLIAEPWIRASNVAGSTTNGQSTYDNVADYNSFNPFVNFNRVSNYTGSLPLVYSSSDTESNYDYRVFEASALDFEAPGYWGRQPLQLAYFFPNDSPDLTKIYNQTAVQNDEQTICPYAGYEGLVNGSKIFTYDSNGQLLNSSNLPVGQTLRTLRNSTTDNQNLKPFINYALCADASTQLVSNSTNPYIGYLDNLDTGLSPNGFPATIVVGQMVLDMFELKQLTTEYIRVELSCVFRDGQTIDNNNLQTNQLYEQTSYPCNLKKSLVMYSTTPSVENFYTTYLEPAYGLYLYGDPQYFASNPTKQHAFMTHAECAQIFCLAFQNWLHAISPPISSLSPRYGFTCVFDAATNRPKFCASVDPWSTEFPGQPYAYWVLYKYGLVLPSPLSNWLGLRAIASPTFRVDYDYNIYKTGWANSYVALYTNLNKDYYNQDYWYRLLKTGGGLGLGITNDIGGLFPNNTNSDNDGAAWGPIKSTGDIGFDSVITGTNTSIGTIETWCSNSEYCAYGGLAFAANMLEPGGLAGALTDNSWENFNGIINYNWHLDTFTRLSMAMVGSIPVRFGWWEGGQKFMANSGGATCDVTTNVSTYVQYNLNMLSLYNSPLQNVTNPGTKYTYTSPLCIWNVKGGWSYQTKVESLTDPALQPSLFGPLYAVDWYQPGLGMPMDIGWNLFDSTGTSVGWNSSFSDCENRNYALESPPLYSLYFESWNNEYQFNFVAWEGRQGLDDQGQVAMPSNENPFQMCDIVNVSWSTRLNMNASTFYPDGPTGPLSGYNATTGNGTGNGMAANAVRGAVNGLPTYEIDTPLVLPAKSTYYWALVARKDPYTLKSCLDNVASIGLLHASSELTQLYNNGLDPANPSAYNAVQQVQNPVAHFMIPSATTNPQVVALSQGAGLVPSTNPFCPYWALPALEVPSNLGSLTKLYNYDAVAYDTSATAALAQVTTQAQSLINSNFISCTKETWNVLNVPNLPAQGSPALTIANPLQLQSMFAGQSQNLNGARTVWPCPQQLALPACIQNTAFPSNTSITLASGMALFVVTEPCFFNVGPTDGGSRKAFATNAYNEYVLWAFNYWDLCPDATQSSTNTSALLQPWSSLSVGQLDPNKFQSTYLQGIPYCMDEAYDAKGPYSTLGRCLRIDTDPARSALSCSTQYAARQPLQPSQTNPVLLFLTPGAGNQQFVPNTTIGPTLQSTYSCGLVYSFTEAYAQLQTYSVAFTSIQDGPAIAFYGLDNLASVKSGAVVASNTSSDASAKTQLRKVYTTFGAAPNPSLGLDIRQVYASQSLCVGPEPLANATQYGPTSVSAYYTNTFHLASFESPDWSLATSLTSLWLPLAGTWTGDLDAVDTLAQFNEPQALPNYEGLSCVAIQALDSNGLPQIVQPNTVPKYQLIAVDRALKAKPRPQTTVVPYDLTSIDLYRPTTTFTLLCDAWRNSLRSVVQVPQSSTNGFVVPNLSILPFSIQYYDCMGHNDYDSTDANTVPYFGICSNATSGSTLATAFSLSSRQPPTWSSNPWTIKDGNTRLWSPFTGGAIWNLLNNPGSGATQDTTVGFSPSLWSPTYQWSTSSTDPNNVWITGVATNATLLQNQYCAFTCTDSSMRKMSIQLGTSEPYAVVDITNNETFYNQGINGVGNDGIPVYSFVDPGRLYNLTYFGHHWWCTADTSAVWTTAPVRLANGQFLEINSVQTVESFQASTIKFRPLDSTEGIPTSWSKSKWPTNQAHQYNLMKVLTNSYNQQCLFVSSVNGDYAVIVERTDSNGVAYFTGPLQIGPNDPTALFFLPEGETLATQYITDVAVLGTLVVCACMPLPLDPRVTSVPWVRSAPGPSGPSGPAKAVPLSIGTLSYASDASSAQELMQGTITQLSSCWSSSLRSSTIVGVTTSFAYDAYQDAQDIVSFMTRFSNSMTTLSVQGSSNSSARRIVSITSQGLVLPMFADGFQALERPAASTTPMDSLLCFYEPNATTSFQSNFQVGFGLYTDSNVSSSNPVQGSIQLYHQVKNALFQAQFTNPVTQKQVLLPALFQGGVFFDDITTAFFVLNSRHGKAQTGLLPYKAYTPPIASYITNNVISDAKALVLQTANGVQPMWNNTLAFQFTKQSLDNGAYYASIASPTLPNSPLSQINASEWTSTDLTRLNLFLSTSIERASPLVANVVLSNFALGTEAGGLALCLQGPFGSEMPLLALLGPTLSPLQYSAVYNKYAPQLTGKAVAEWNPYEMKFYIAAPGTNIPDWYSASFGFPQSELLSNIRPDTISEAEWANATYKAIPYANKSRLLLLTADASTGIVQSDNSAIRWTQVYYPESKSGSGKSTKYALALVSQQFTSIMCFGFSQHATAVGGTFVPINGNAIALMYWRTNIAPGSNDLQANWSRIELGPGYVTAIQFVGYAWYIATWNPQGFFNTVTQVYEGQSSLYFASINFNAISILDSFNTNTNVANYIQSIQASVQQSGVCADGYEPSPSNPNVCLKKCPTGFTPYNNLCVQACPLPFTETGLSNECKPDTMPATLIQPTNTNPGTAQTIGPSFRNGKPVHVLPTLGSQSGSLGSSALGPSNTNSLNYTLTIVYVVLICLVFFLLAGFVIRMVSGTTGGKVE